MKKSVRPSVERRPSNSKSATKQKKMALPLKGSHEAVVLLNRAGEITFMNEPAEKLTGFSKSLSLGKRVDQVFNFRKESTGDPVRLPVDEVVDLGNSVSLSHLVLVSRQGIEIPVKDLWIPIQDPSHPGAKLKTLGVILICSDLRKQRAARAKRLDLEAQVRHSEKLGSIGILTGGIAHDFNNLLCVILGNTNLALAKLEDREFVASKLKMIETTSQRATELVKQILSYTGKSQSVAELANLSHLVGEMGSLLQTSISRKVEIHFAFSERPPVLKADVAQLRQVIMNLIINASDAIGDHRGTITVETGVMNVTQDYLLKASMGLGLNPGRYVYLQVADTGSGMDEATQAKIFEPFFTTKVTGRGLGLAAVLGIVRNHGGGLHLESKLGVGTTFRVFFPAEEAYTLKFHELDEAGVAPAVSKPTHKGGTILVVDDEGNILTLVKEVLEYEGFKVLTAESGAGGVELYKQKNQEIDAVLLDMSMPDMDGTEVADQMRQVRADAKIMLSSGYHEEDIITRLTAHGIKHFIQKPFMPDKLITKVYEAMERTPEPVVHP